MARAVPAVLVSFCFAALLCAQAAPSPANQRAPLKVGVLGASVSDGFGCRLSEQRDDGVYEATFKLADMLPLVCPDLPMQIENGATGRMFLGVERFGKEAAAAVREKEPQCVFALDYLFWFCYGRPGKQGDPERTEGLRLESLERGLAELATFDVPIVVGDIPDMSKAVGKMLTKAQMPPLESIAAANARIAAWAKERPNVHVVALSKMIRQLHDEAMVTVAGKVFASTEAQPLMQKDDLHATPYGLAAITCILVDTLRTAEPDLKLPAVDPQATIERAKQKLARKDPSEEAGQREGRESR